jgi:pteridine reductase
MDLSGKVALVTGAARRVGRAIAVELAAAGARLVIHHAASPTEAAELARSLGGATVVQADLRDRGAAARVIEVARAEQGGIDVLVNSAAGFEHAAFESLSDAQWDAMLELNLLAPMRLARAAAPVMRARGAGVIVNILDVAAFTAWRGFAHYGVAKAGLCMLTRNLALELAPVIRTVGIAPGTVLFPDHYSPSDRARVTARIPLGREGTPADVARAARFLCEQDYITGAVLPVDGGRLAGSSELL